MMGKGRGEGERGRERERGREGEMKKRIQYHWELEVYTLAFDAAMRIFELTKAFPGEEKYSLTDQMRRASRSVCANIAEAWRKRRYEAALVSKLTDSEAEAAETQVWVAFGVKCGYLSREAGSALHKAYDDIIGKLVNMIRHPEDWHIRESP